MVVEITNLPNSQGISCGNMIFVIKKKLDYLLISFCVSEYFACCMHVHHTHAWYSWRLEEGVRSPGIGVIDSSGTMWVLGTEPKSFAQVTNALNVWAISQPRFVLFVTLACSMVMWHLCLAFQYSHMVLTVWAQSINYFLSLFFTLINCFFSVFVVYYLFNYLFSASLEFVKFIDLFKQPIAFSTNGIYENIILYSINTHDFFICELFPNKARGEKERINFLFCWFWVCVCVCVIEPMGIIQWLYHWPSATGPFHGCI